jgi:hypothetical protein
MLHFCSVPSTSLAGCMLHFCPAPFSRWMHAVYLLRAFAGRMLDLCSTLFPKSMHQTYQQAHYRTPRPVARISVRHSANDSCYHSASPHRRCSSSPDRSSRRPRLTQDANCSSGFQPGANGNALPVCAICLGRQSVPLRLSLHLGWSLPNPCQTHLR